MVGDEYTNNLLAITNLYRSRGVAGLLAANDLCAKEHTWGHNICRSISGNIREYIFRRYVYAGGQCVVLQAEERMERGEEITCRDVALKFSLPMLSPAPASSLRHRRREEQKKIVPKKQKKPEKVKGLMKASRYVKEAFRAGIKEKKKAQKERQKVAAAQNQAAMYEKFATQETCRIERGVKLQKKCRDRLASKGLLAYGVIPDVYLYSPPTQQFIVEEWVEGEEWVAWCQRNEDKKVLELFLSLLRLLEEIHKLGVVHRDIKPNNLKVFTKTSVPVLLDWGLAKAPGVGADVTTPEVVRGAPLYMDAKSYGGDFHLGKKTADIFQAGSVLWAMLARRQVDDSQLIKERDEHGNIVWDIKEIRELYDQDLLPEPIRPIFSKTTDAEEKRYRTMRDFRVAVQQVIATHYSSAAICEKPCKWVISLKKEFIDIEENIRETRSLINRLCKAISGDKEKKEKT